MDKTINQKAWFLVLPVFLVVAFSAILPLMTVVNYSMQDTFGNNQFFWNGIGWYQELLDPTSQLVEKVKARAGAQLLDGGGFGYVVTPEGAFRITTAPPANTKSEIESEAWRL